jgi:hypothetical protein
MFIVCVAVETDTGGAGGATQTVVVGVQPVPAIQTYLTIPRADLHCLNCPFCSVNVIAAFALPTVNEARNIVMITAVTIMIL